MESQRVQKAQQIINHFAKTLSDIVIQEEFGQIIDVIKNCKGKIVTTGMGKAGIAMRKFSSTLCSLGVPSCYLQPGEASHGDLGLIGSDDILFVASTSGKTREVLETIEQSRIINQQPIIGITSHIDSPLREKLSFVLNMGDIEEAGDIKMAPTTSIIVILAITDALALVLSDELGITKESFGKYHHSGYLGAVARNDGEIF